MTVAHKSSLPIRRLKPPVSVGGLLALCAFFTGAASAQTKIAIQNYSFENPVQTSFPGYTHDGTIPGWSSNNPADSAVGVWNPTLTSSLISTPFFTAFIPDGNQIGYIGDGLSNGGYDGVSIVQQTNSTVLANTTYTLTAAFGHRLDSYTGTASLELWAGTVSNGVVTGNLLASASVDTGTIPSGSFTNVSATLFTGASNPNVGSPLVVEIVDTGGNSPSGNQINFDNVRLTSRPVPEAGTMLGFGSLMVLGGLGFLRSQRRK